MTLTSIPTMNHLIRITASISSVLFVLVSCSSEEQKDYLKSEQTGIISTRASIAGSEGYCYHSGTDLVLQAYDLFSDPNIHRLDEHFSESTHLGVKFFPGSFEQQRYLSNLESISISFIPFGYSPVSPKQQEGLDRETLPVFPEINPYTVDTKGYKNTESEYNPKIGGIIRLPIVYALWPKEIPIPEDIEYEICFEAKLPGGADTKTTRGPGWDYGYNASFKTYDSLLSSYVPLRKLRVDLSYGIYSGTAYTNSQGFVTLSPQIVGLSVDHYSDLSVIVVLDTADWIISRDTSSTPIHQVIGTTGELWSTPFNGGTHNENLISITTEYEIHRAVDYYFNSSHSLSGNIAIGERGKGTIIHAMNNPGSYMAFTLYDSSMEPFIIVYNGYSSQNDCIASVLHELGHIRLLIHKGYNIHESCTNALQESHASFVGWYLGNSYYTSKGFIIPNAGYEISYQGRQDWMPGYGNYTPFFVDLNDDYNQSAINDPISGYLPNYVDYLALTYNSITDCGTYLYSLYPSDDLSDYLLYYTGL